jgi:hypothetical protein
MANSSTLPDLFIPPAPLLYVLRASRLFPFKLIAHFPLHPPFPFVMKFSIGLATFTLLIATAVVEATLHDAAAHKRHASHINPRDVVHRAGKRCKTRPPGHSSSTHHTEPTSIPPASNSTPIAPPPKPSSPAHEASSLIQVNPGQCNPIGASSTSRGGVCWS